MPIEHRIIGMAICVMHKVGHLLSKSEQLLKTSVRFKQTIAVNEQLLDTKLNEVV